MFSVRSKLPMVSLRGCSREKGRAAACNEFFPQSYDTGLLPFLGKPELVLKNVLLIQANPWPLERGRRDKFG